MGNDTQQEETEPHVRKTRDYEDPAPASRQVQSNNLHKARKESRHAIDQLE